jgi:hypothetical protein
MSRPRYVSPQDEANELRIINSFCDIVSEQFGKQYQAFKLPDYLIIDYALHTGKRKEVHAFVEVKRRHLDHDQITSIIMSFEKYHALMNMYERGFRSLLIFEFNDGIFRLDIQNIAHPNPSINGRKDRNDPMDMEVVIWIHKNLWIPIREERR